MLKYKGLKAIVLLLAGVLFSTCTEEIGLYSKSQPVPIVYCLLDPTDSVQYVRIGRSYQAEPNRQTESPPADSTVWQTPVEVYIEEYTDGVISNRYTFAPDTMITQNSGFFPTNNLRLYSSALRPLPGNDYRLYVYFPDLMKMVSGRIRVNGAPEIADPIPLSIRKINFEPGQPFTIRWYPGEETGVYEMIFRIHYRDSSDRSVDFRIADYSNGGLFDQQTSQLQETQMGGPAFFAAMASQIPIVAGAVREVISVEFIMISGGTDLAFLYRSNHEIGSDFTNLLEYSNLSNGMGIFSSRSEVHVPNLELSEVTLDLLAHGEVTRALGFKDSKGNRL